MSVATTRAVAQGVIGLCLLVAGVPWAIGDYGNVEAAACSALLFVSGMACNVLKPLLLVRGVDAPMPVILLGANGNDPGSAA